LILSHAAVFKSLYDLCKQQPAFWHQGKTISQNTLISHIAAPGFILNFLPLDTGSSEINVNAYVTGN